MSSPNDLSLSLTPQDDWINMLTGMDNFLDTDGISDIGTPTLTPTNSSSEPTSCDLNSMTPEENPVVVDPPSTVNACDVPTTGQPSSEFQQPSSPDTVEYPLTSKRKAVEPVVTNSSDDTSKNAISAEAKAQARSERKRTREKQRRLDVNSQITDLTTLLLKVEGDEEGDGGVPKGQSSNIPSNRVDLISRTIAVLSRIHNENKKRGREVLELKAKIEEMKKRQEAAENEARNSARALAQQQMNVKPNEQKQQQQPVFMMVPMMVSPDSLPNATQSGFMPQAIQMPMQMQMCPQVFPAPQSAQATSNVFPTVMQPNVMSQKPQVVYYPGNTAQVPAPTPVQATTIQPSFVADKPKTQQQIQGQGYTTVTFDSSQMNMSMNGGNLAHCA